MPTTTTTVRARLPRTLAGLASHPWVESIDDGRETGDNLHVYLRPGFVWAGTSSAVIESTVREACQAFREVTWDPAAWGQACGASAAEVAALTGEAAPAQAAPEAAPARAQVEVDQHRHGEWQRTGIGPEPVAVAERRAAIWAERNPEHRYRVVPVAPRPVLPGEAEPPAPVAQDGPAPELPRLRADAAAGRPVSLAALARAIAEDLLTPSPSPVSLAALRPEA